jgi:hypothetical protein
LGAVIAAVLAGALTLNGCASAAAKPGGTTKANPRPSAAAKVGPPAAAARGAANIMAYSIDSDGPAFSTVVTGAVGDYGPAMTVLPDGTVDPGHTSELELRLTHGSFRLNIAELGKKIVAATSHEPIYPRTCSTFIRVAAATPIVAGSGTGSYQGISGSFTVGVTVDEVHPTPCQSELTFVRQVLVLSGSGSVSVG